MAISVHNLVNGGTNAIMCSRGQRIVNDAGANSYKTMMFLLGITLNFPGNEAASVRYYSSSSLVSFLYLVERKLNTNPEFDVARRASTDFCGTLFVDGVTPADVLIYSLRSVVNDCGSYVFNRVASEFDGEIDYNKVGEGFLRCVTGSTISENAFCTLLRRIESGKVIKAMLDALYNSPDAANVKTLMLSLKSNREYRNICADVVAKIAAGR